MSGGRANEESAPDSRSVLASTPLHSATHGNPFRNSIALERQPLAARLRPALWVQARLPIVVSPRSFRYYACEASHRNWPASLVRGKFV
jgi:hypothetical protein